MKITSWVDDIADRLIFPSFSRIGPELRQRVFNWDDVDVSGRTIAITGPTSGIGLTTATILHKLGANLILIARNPDKAHKLQKDLASHGAEPTVIIADLSKLDTVREAARTLAKQPLDGLIHNGGGLHDSRQLTADGIELTLATHVVAPFLLTQLAMPGLTASKDARVITVSSGGLYPQRIRIDDLQTEDGYSGSAAYARSKRAQVVLNRLWAEKTASSQISFHAMHPGWVNTPGITEALPRFSGLISPVLRTPEQGADTIVWLAGAERNKIGSGQFWLDRRPRPTVYFPNTRTSAIDSVRLWEEVERLAGLGSVS